MIGGQSCMSDTPKKLSGEFHDLFSDVNALNQYSQTKSLKIKDSLIEDYELDGATFLNAEFQNTLWKNINASNALFNNSTIVNSTFENVDFSKGRFKNCVFQHIKFNDTVFDESSIDQIEFIDCKFQRCSLQSVDGKVLLKNSSLQRTSFSKSEIELSINSCNITNSKFYKLKASYLRIFHSTFEEVNFSSSEIDRVLIQDLNAKKGVYFDHSTIYEFKIDGSSSYDKMSLNRSHVQQVIVEQSTFQGIGFSLGGIISDKIIISNCKNNSMIAPAEAKINKIFIQNSTMSSLVVFDSIIKYLSITDCSISDKSYWEDATIYKLEIKNVFFNGEHDFSNVVLKDIFATDIKKGNKYKTIPEKMRKPF